MCFSDNEANIHHTSNFSNQYCLFLPKNVVHVSQIASCNQYYSKIDKELILKSLHCIIKEKTCKNTDCNTDKPTVNINVESKKTIKTTKYNLGNIKIA